MKNLILRILAAVCCVWAINAYAKIILDPPPDVPTGLDSQTFKKLASERNDLLAQFGETQEKIDAQARDCHDVEEGSPKVAECMTKATDVRAAARSYREALARFNEGIAAGVAWQQSASNTDAKLALSAKHPAHPIGIESHGEFHVVAADGSPLSGQNPARLAEKEGVRLVTGHDGEVIMTLPDGTRIRLGPDTVFVPKIQEPKPAPGGSPTMELVEGTLRWVHKESSEMLKMLHESSVERARESRHTLLILNVAVAVRGTDFESVVLPDGSGHIKLFSGEISVTSKLTGADVTLTHGQMITFTKDKVGSVMLIPEGR